MFSSMIGLALALAPSPAANLTAWQSDYRQAKSLAAREHKPLAVVIGTGAANWDNVVSAGSLGDTAINTIRSTYVCVYIDTATEAGKKLAKEFDFTGPGVIISDRTGELQAYRQVGTVEATKLTTTLVKYAESDRVVKTTEVVAPVTITTPHFQPAYYQALTGACRT